MPTVISVYNTSLFGSPDPSGLTYDPVTGSLFLVDSEVDEKPFFSSTNLFSLGTEGSLKQSYAFATVTKEPTGIAVDPASDQLFVADDEKSVVYVVSRTDPSVKLGQFSTATFGATHVSDLALGRDSNLFILDQSTRTIYETSFDGTLQSFTALPMALKRPEGIAYDAQNDVFYISGGWSADIFKVSREGVIVDTIKVLRDFRTADGSHAAPKGLVLAPSSDDSGAVSLWVADYGKDQVNDGRLFEIKLHTPPSPPPPPPPPTPSLLIVDGTPQPQMEAAGASVSFMISISAAAGEDVVVNYRTVDGTAKAGSDFVGVSGGQAVIGAGETSTSISIQLINDMLKEGTESFTVQIDSARLANSNTPLTVLDSSGVGTIADNDPAALMYDTSLFGSPDPAGLAYDPTTQTIFLVDSEVDERPFFSNTNMFGLDLAGHLKQGYSLTGFTNEPTGVSYWKDPTTGVESLFVADDDARKIYKVDLDNSGVKVAEFSTLAFDCTDPEDVAVNPLNGNLFIVGELTRSIYEVTQQGDLVSQISLAAEIKNPEAVAYNPVIDMFYVSGFFSADIFKVSREGATLGKITALREYRLADGGHALPKGLVLTPSSGDPDKLSLWVADYGRDQVNDGRLFEIALDESSHGVFGPGALGEQSQDVLLLG
jgi:hypothetical protein